MLSGVVAIPPVSSSRATRDIQGREKCRSDVITASGLGGAEGAIVRHSVR